MFFRKIIKSFNRTTCIRDLAKRLDKLKIPYKLSSISKTDDGFDKMTFPWTRADVICNFGSYGHEKGEFEVMGRDLQTAEEASWDEVTGHIKLKDMVKRIQTAYNRTFEETKEEKRKSVNEYFKRRNEYGLARLTTS